MFRNEMGRRLCCVEASSKLALYNTNIKLQNVILESTLFMQNNKRVSDTVRAHNGCVEEADGNVSIAVRED